MKKYIVIILVYLSFLVGNSVAEGDSLASYNLLSKDAWSGNGTNFVVDLPKFIVVDESLSSSIKLVIYNCTKRDVFALDNDDCRLTYLVDKQGEYDLPKYLSVSGATSIDRYKLLLYCDDPRESSHSFVDSLQDTVPIQIEGVLYDNIDSKTISVRVQINGYFKETGQPFHAQGVFKIPLTKEAKK